jgi:hypothetical protein
MDFNFSSGLRGIGQVIFYGLLSRAVADVEFVGLNEMFSRQYVDFTAGNVLYFTNFDSRAKVGKSMVFETLTEINEKGMVEKYGWATQTKSDAIIKIFRDNHEWVLYVFLAGEMTDLIRSNPKYMERKINPYTKKTYEVCRVPVNDLGHKTPIRVPIVGEPDVSAIRDVHDYISKYK